MQPNLRIEDAKKEPKGAKPLESGEEKKEEPPLDSIIPKALDYIYFLTDYPTTKEEFAELSKAGGAIDLVLQIDQKVLKVKQLLDDEEDDMINPEEFEQQLKEKLNQFEQTFQNKDGGFGRNGDFSAEDIEFMKSTLKSV